MQVNKKMKRKKHPQRNLKREGLEVYLLYLIMVYRPLFQIFGILLCIYSIAAYSYSLVAGSFSLLLAVLLFLVANTYRTALYLAKLVAWIGTLWEHNHSHEKY
jgi:hypothetical protein